MKTIIYLTAASAMLILGACGGKKDSADQNMNHEAMPAIEAAEAENMGHAMIALPTVQCDNCKAIIEGGLVKTAGILSVSVDVAGKMGHINFDADKLTAADVDQAIAMLGYQANETAADPAAYAALPACCKVPE
ncbi:heavy-metal-associated domain-containing protein [Candidatus Neomarinimicrobiota bacterium]